MRILVVIPTHNEEIVIEQSVRATVAALRAGLTGHEWTVLVADNGSTDRTREIVRLVATELPGVELWTTEAKGRGNALRSVWIEWEADAYVYMDADLATDLAHLPELIAELERSHLVVGSRFAGAALTRSAFRELVSRAYRLISHAIVPLRTNDLQCGFKAIRGDAAREILPLATHDGWFFDTELIAHAERRGFVVTEIPVRWEERRDVRRKSSVNVFSTAIDNIRHLWILRKKLKRTPNG